MLFYFVVGLFAVTAASSVSNLIPSQVHIAIAGAASSGISVSYQTVATTTTSTVKYGKTSKSYSFLIQGTQSIYYETVHHHIVLTDLTPLTKYYYIVGDENGGWSNEFYFISPASSSLRGNFSFLVFADLGTVNGGPSNDMLTNIKDANVLAWHGGDVGYADDSFLHAGCAVSFCYEKAYDQYMSGEIYPKRTNVFFVIQIYFWLKF